MEEINNNLKEREVIQLSPEEVDLIIECCEDETTVEIQGNIYECVTCDSFIDSIRREGAYYVIKRLSDGIHFMLRAYYDPWTNWKVNDYMKQTMPVTTTKFV